MQYQVTQGKKKVETPDGPQDVEFRVLTVIDPDTGITLQIPMPTPEAEGVGRALLGEQAKPGIEIPGNGDRPAPPEPPTHQ